VCTLDPEKNYEALNPAVLRANRMAAAISFCCQGRLFFLSGEEFGRTKGGVKNSYNASPEINRLDWSRAWANRSLVDYYRGLIDLRMQLPALQDKSAQAAQRIVSAVELAPNCVGISGSNTGDDSKWDKLLLLCNSGGEDREVHLPHGTWQLLADEKSSFRWQLPIAQEGHITVPGVSALILGRIEAK